MIRKVPVISKNKISGVRDRLNIRTLRNIRILSYTSPPLLPLLLSLSLSLSLLLLPPALA